MIGYFIYESSRVRTFFLKPEADVTVEMGEISLESWKLAICRRNGIFFKKVGVNIYVSKLRKCFTLCKKIQKCFEF